jgi:hypothetical protein
MAWRGREGGRTKEEGEGRLWWTGRADADDVGVVVVDLAGGWCRARWFARGRDRIGGRRFRFALVRG